ncbi:MAG: Glutamate racemase [Candidatus Parcubacteria bacterium]|jgi:glutamate racemase
MIGFYDTGLGGQRIADMFGTIADILYICYQDRESLPLGDKTQDQIRNIVIVGVEKLFRQGCNLVVLACNTASVSTIRYIQSTWLPQNHPTKQVLGVTVPLREYLDEFSQLKSQKGLLLATQATIQTGFYQEYLAQFNYNLDYLSCTNLADSIEKDVYNQDIEYTQSVKILQNLSKQVKTKPDYIILACTHYGYISKQIKDIFQTPQVLDPSRYTAERLVDYLERHKEYR